MSLDLLDFQHKDVLMLVCSRADNTTLQSLSRTPLWNIVREFVSSPYFWYLRTQFLMQSQLQMRPDSNWKRAYYSLEHAKNKGKLYTKHTCSDVLTLNVLFELGHKPKYITLLRAVQAENYEAVRLVLRTRTKRSTEKRIYRDHYVLSEAINRDNLSIVSLLLDEGEINPTAISHPQSLELAIAVGSYKITERLLQDPRMDPTVNDGQAILEAIKADRYDLLELLRRRDPRVVELEPEIRTLHYEEVARSTYYDCLEDHRRDDYWTYLCD